MPVEFQARTDDQLPIPDHAAALQHERIALRLEGSYRRLDPVHAARDQRAHGAGSVACLEGAGSHQRPPRLVVVDVGRVDDGNVEAGAARQQAGGDRDAGRAAADDHHRVLRLGHFERRPGAIGDAAHHGIEVIAGAGAGVDDVGRRHAACLRQRPERGRAHAGAAKGQDGRRQASQQRGELPALFVADLARLRRQVMGFDPGGNGCLLYLGKKRLVIAFAVRPVADQRTESGLPDGVHVGRQHLGRHRNAGRKRMNLHTCLSYRYLVKVAA